MLFALLPIVIVHTAKLMPPILFAGISMMIAALVVFFYMILKGQISTLFNKTAFKYILGVTFFIVIIPSILIYTGASKTSSVNTAILLQTEIFFTLLILGMLKQEKITIKKIIASLLITLGAICVIYNGSLKLNPGDLLIIAGTVAYPIGNMYAKKALKLTSSGAILLIRSALGGIFLIIISLLFEDYTNAFSGYITDNIFMLLLNGILLYSISKLLWYEGLKRLDISKSISISMSHPALSFIYAYIFLKEIPTAYQFIGFIVIMSGIYVITRQPKKIGVVEID